jgi:hypothetical protein
MPLTDMYFINPVVEDVLESPQKNGIINILPQRRICPKSGLGG